MEKHSIKWTAPEYDHHEKRTSWYWISVIAAVLLVAFAVWQRNFLFAVFVVIAELLVITWGFRAPRLVQFSADERGLSVGDEKRYSWGELKHFSMDHDAHPDEGWKDMVIHFNHHFRTALRLRIPMHEHENVRSFFAEHVPEVEFHLTLTDAIEKIIKF